MRRKVLTPSQVSWLLVALLAIGLSAVALQQWTYAYAGPNGNGQRSLMVHAPAAFLISTVIILGWLLRQGIHQMHSQQQRLQSIFQSLAEGVVIQNARGEIIEANTEACTILGLARDELLGRESVDPRWQAIREDGSPWPAKSIPLWLLCVLAKYFVKPSWGCACLLAS